MSLRFENFGKRFCAYLIDMFVLFLLFLLLGWFNSMFSMMSPLTQTLVFYVLTMLYFAVQESGSYQATFGKRILGLYVVRSNGSAEKISFLRALARNFARLINAPIYCFGYVFILLTKKQQGLHDLIARTMVVDGSLEEDEDSSEEESSEEGED